MNASYKYNLFLRIRLCFHAFLPVAVILHPTLAQGEGHTAGHVQFEGAAAAQEAVHHDVVPATRDDDVHQAAEPALVVPVCDAAQALAAVAGEDGELPAEGPIKWWHARANGFDIQWSTNPAILEPFGRGWIQIQISCTKKIHFVRRRNE